MERGMRAGDTVRFVIDLIVLCLGVLVFALVILGWNWILNG